MRRGTRSFRPTLIGLLVVAGGLPLASPAPALAISTTLVINEVDYDQPSTDTAEFVEIKNVSGGAINLNGFSIVLVNGTGGGAAIYQTIALPDVTLAGGDYFVVCGNAANTANCDLDVTPDTNLIQNGAPDAVGLRQGVTLIDAVSYEGDTGAPYTERSGSGLEDDAANANESISRCPDGFDTDQNNVDFALRPATPGAVNDCPTGDTDPDPVELCDVEDSDLTLINEIQGSGATTPISGQSVITRGVVTADFTSGGASNIPRNQGLRGFFMEAIANDRDGNALTSEGIFIFDGDGTFAGNLGDLVYIDGTAGEFGGVTQVSAAELKVCGTGVDLRDPVSLPLPTSPADRATVFEPLESMRVTHAELTVIEFFQLERFGEIRLSADGVLQTPTNVFLPGSAAAIGLAAHNAAVNIILDDGRTGTNLNRLDEDGNLHEDLLPYVEAGGTLRIGDQLLAQTFVLHFGFGNFPQWRLQPIDIDELTQELVDNRTRPRPENPPDVGGNVTVASFNVLNYFDGDGQGGGFPTSRGATTPSELERQTDKLVDAIIRLDADIYGLIEIENDGGEFNATRTLVDALNAHAGGEVYRYVDTGVIGSDEIKQAFVYRKATVTPVGDWAILTSEVDPRFDDELSRPALAQTFLAKGTGERVTVVVNHFKSKSASGLTDPTDPNFDQGDGQGFWNHARTLAAEALADWLATNPTRVQSVGSLIIGDLNAYGREDPIRALEDAGYEDQLIRYTDGIPYTFTFDGMQGTLDTALALPSLAARVTGSAVWHINADEVPAIDYQESVGFPGNARFRTPEIAAAYYDPSAFRSSDHDPVLVGLQLGRGRGPR